MQYEFTNNWFGNVGEKIWTQLLPQITPEKMLEIGCFEGWATTHLIEKSVWSDQCEIFCVDTWDGGLENKIRGVNMSKVEERFEHNVALAQKQRTDAPKVNKLKGLSHQLLPRLLADGHENSFDFIYVDGSHQSPDVLVDAVLSFLLCKTGDVIGFDDYSWFDPSYEVKDIVNCPKLAIDSFINVYFRKIDIIRTPNAKMYIRKISN